MNLLQPKSMQYASLYMVKEDAPLVSVILASSGFFDPSRANPTNTTLPDRYAEEYRKTFDLALRRWQKVSRCLDIPVVEHINNIANVDIKELEQANDKLGDIWQTCSLFTEQQHQLDEKEKHIHQSQELLLHFSELDIDLSLIQAKLDFLDIRLGIVPLTHIARLQDALGIEGYYLSVYLKSTDSAHVVVAGLNKTSDTIKPLLDVASFKQLTIPREFQDHPLKLNKKLEQELITVHEERRQLQKQLLSHRGQYYKELQRLGVVLTLAEPFALLSQEMQGSGALTNINGWIPEDKIAAVSEQITFHLQDRVVLSSREPEIAEQQQTPSYMAYPGWMKSFVKLVSNYGIPRYSEIDPSWFFTITYVLMYGVMFGDIGHGAVIIGLGLIAHQKWPKITSFLVSIGLSSMLFGFIYGSVFCYEHVIPALWMSPLNDPMLMLKLAFIWGACFILILNVISILNFISARRMREAMVDRRGLTGLLLYSAILWFLYKASENSLSWSISLLILLPLLIIATDKWYRSSASHGERVLVIAIEAYEMVINNLANTISFLRVAAFGLNHVALAISIFTLASMLDVTGHWITIILGNLFIILVEGAIVGIQVLRLEYYEGFSRFYHADGYLFKPLSLSPQQLLAK